MCYILSMKGLDIKSFIAREGERQGVHKQEDLAKMLGVSDQTVSNWVKGKTFPTHETEDKLLKMGMTVEELFGYPYPSSADDLRRKGAMWDILNKYSLQSLKNDLHVK